MKLISYRRRGRESFGVVKDGGIVDMTARLDGAFAALKDAVAGLGLSRIEAAANVAASRSARRAARS